MLKRSNLKTLQSKNLIFPNMCEFFRGKSQIVILSTFDQREFKKIIILTKMCTVCKKGHFLPFVAHCTHFCQNDLFFFKFTLIKSTQNSYLESEFIPKTFKKKKMFSKKNFPSGLVTKLENLIVFGKIL